MKYDPKNFPPDSSADFNDIEPEIEYQKYTNETLDSNHANYRNYNPYDDEHHSSALNPENHPLHHFSYE